MPNHVLEILEKQELREMGWAGQMAMVQSMQEWAYPDGFECLDGPKDASWPEWVDANDIEDFLNAVDDEEIDEDTIKAWGKDLRLTLLPNWQQMEVRLDEWDGGMARKKYIANIPNRLRELKERKALRVEKAKAKQQFLDAQKNWGEHLKEFHDAIQYAPNLNVLVAIVGAIDIMAQQAHKKQPKWMIEQIYDKVKGFCPERAKPEPAMLYLVGFPVHMKKANVILNAWNAEQKLKLEKAGFVPA